jgi:hypothetical protein
MSHSCCSLFANSSEEPLYRVNFIDTLPMWMEKSIDTAKRRGIMVADADTGHEYYLRLIDDEAAFRACGKP